jgi:hypothetical protein
MSGGVHTLRTGDAASRSIGIILPLNPSEVLQKRREWVASKKLADDTCRPNTRPLMVSFRHLVSTSSMIAWSDSLICASQARMTASGSPARFDRFSRQRIGVAGEHLGMSRRGR